MATKPEIRAWLEWDEGEEMAKFTVEFDSVKNERQFQALRMWYMTELAPALRMGGYAVKEYERCLLVTP